MILHQIWFPSMATRQTKAPAQQTETNKYLFTQSSAPPHAHTGHCGYVKILLLELRQPTHTSILTEKKKKIFRKKEKKIFFLSDKLRWAACVILPDKRVCTARETTGKKRRDSQLAAPHHTYWRDISIFVISEFSLFSRFSFCFLVFSALLLFFRTKLGECVAKLGATGSLVGWKVQKRAAL